MAISNANPTQPVGGSRWTIVETRFSGSYAETREHFVAAHLLPPSDVLDGFIDGCRFWRVLGGITGSGCLPQSAKASVLCRLKHSFARHQKEGLITF